MKRILSIIAIALSLSAVVGVCVWGTVSASAADTETTEAAKDIRVIYGLKCPNHDYLRDNWHFTYECIGGIAPNNGTYCLRCGYTKSLHKPQK